MEQISSISRMIKGRISISQCEVKQLNTAPCDAQQGWENAVDRRARADLFCNSSGSFHYPLLRQRGIFPLCVYLKPYRKWRTLEFTLLSPTPHAKVSWDLEFMGTRSSFSDSWIFFACLHILPPRSFFLANHFRALPPPLAAAIFFSFSHR